MSQIIRIVAAIVDTTHLTLYKEDGTTVTIPQGDPRVRPIINEASSQIVKQGFAYVDISVENEYKKFEEESKGSVKFFKIAKDKLKSWFSSKKEDPVQAAVVGQLPSLSKAVEEILQHAIPVTHPEFTEDDMDKQKDIVESNGCTPTDSNVTSESSHTMVAVTNNTVVPGVEKIKTQFIHATKLGSTKGVEAFLARAGKVADQRSHSIEDLLKFMERGDLPIADDGSILIYKVLNKRDGKYRDVHSGNVPQWVGAYVHMDTSLVDHNRNNECSNGLHVARRGYISQFVGDVCTLCKVAPEDVIAVPTYDANKMRVCGYHILFELSPAQFSLVKANKPISDDPAGAVMLANAISGKHTRRTDEVKITGHKGAGIVTKELATIIQVVERPPEVIPVQPREALANPSDAVKEEAVAPKAVVKQVTAAKKAMPKAKPIATKVNGVANDLGSPRERIQKLLAVGITSKGVAEAILKLKKDAKKGWGALGVTDAQVAEIMRIAGYGSM